MSLLGGALGSVVGGLFGLAGSKMQANSAASQAELQARLQRENWEYMQKNAHQFEIQDLKSAGLNPILSATHSQLASMPSVSAGSTMDNPFSHMSGLINSALAREQEKKLKMMDLEIKDKELGLKEREIGIAERNSAQSIEESEKRIDEADQRIKGMILDNQIKVEMKNANVKEIMSRCALNGELAYKAMQDARVSSVTADKLEHQLKYGFLISHYLPPDMADFVKDNVVTWVQNHQDVIEAFRDGFRSDMTNEEVKDFTYHLLERFGVIDTKSMRVADRIVKGR